MFTLIRNYFRVEIVGLVAMCLLLILTSPGHAASRYALVIGNSAYTGSPPLKNPTNDAKLIGDTLTEVGFDVTMLTDGTQKQMRRAMLDFSRKLRNDEGSVGLFYYAGHGLQVRGINYMVPVTADIKDEEEVRFEGVDINDFLGTMRSSNSRLNIVILDACRNNPFARSFRSASRGLAPVQAASGTLIAYSTAPGDVAFDGQGLNSPYTLALSRFMRRGGLQVETVFKRVLAAVEDATERKQTPWLTGAFRGEFFFRNQQNSTDQSQSGGGSPNTTSSTKQNANALEKLFWESIHTSTNPASFKAYLTAFPNGLFVPLANIKITELEQAKKSITVAKLEPPSSSTMFREAEVEADEDIVAAATPKRRSSSLFAKAAKRPATAKTEALSPPPVAAAMPAAKPAPTASPKLSNILSYRSVFTSSSTRELKRADVKNLDCHKLWMARNEIYHRKGYCFKTEKGIRYFDNSNCSTSRVKLNSTESRNVRTLRASEIRKRCAVKKLRG